MTRLTGVGYTRFVEIGRVAYIDYGMYRGRLVAIVDVIDQNRALVDGPCSGVPRQSMNFNKLHLTSFVLKLGPSARSGTVRKIWEKEEINRKWAETTWAKKISAREKRAKLNDFDRFKLMKAKQSRNKLIRERVGRLRKTAKKNPPKVKKITRKKKTKK